MRIEERNWKEIQAYYDEGNSTRDIIIKYKLSHMVINKASKLGYLELRNRSEANKIKHEKYPLVHTPESKKKISKARIKYLVENPDKMPYRLYHSSKESYPEKYFAELFQKENITVERYLPVSIYELDFCIPDKRINIEIDGNQHYTVDIIAESDIRRNAFLSDKGWDTIRIKWSDYQKMDFEGKTKYISELKDYINKLTNEKPTIPFVENGMKLCECGTKILKTSKRCKKCADINQRKTIRPDINQLITEVKDSSYLAVSKKYGVSDNTIRKWIKKAS